MHVTKISATQVAISGCVASYPHLDEPRAVNPQSPPKFGMVTILPKTLDQADLDTLNLMVQEVATQRWPNGVPAHFKHPLKDANEKGKTPLYAGHYAMNTTAQADRRPQVVLEDAKTPAPRGTVYPGCGVNVYLGCYSYDTGSNAGVSFGLNAVQVADRTLPHLDGGKDASEVFSPVAAPMGAPAAVPGVPAPAAPAAAPAGMPPQVAPAPHQPSPVAAPAAPVLPGAPITPGSSALN